MTERNNTFLRQTLKSDLQSTYHWNATIPDQTVHKFPSVFLNFLYFKGFSHLNTEYRLKIIKHFLLDYFSNPTSPHFSSEHYQSVIELKSKWSLKLWLCTKLTTVHKDTIWNTYVRWGHHKARAFPLTVVIFFIKYAEIRLAQSRLRLAKYYYIFQHNSGKYNKNAHFLDIIRMHKFQQIANC